MMQIKLINMPFASVHMPSLALLQLQSFLEKAYGDKVNVEVLDISLDFSRYLGAGLYQNIFDGPACLAGVGEWLCRLIAFPRAKENHEQYFQEYLSEDDEATVQLRADILEKQKGLPEFFESLIDRYGLDSADLVGFTSLFAQNVPSIAMARCLKRRNPALITVMGGANCETPVGMEVVKIAEAVDFVFTGPSLKSFTEFVGLLLEGRRDALSEIKGVLNKEKVAAIEAAGTLSKCGSELNGEQTNMDTLIVDLDYETFLKNFHETFPNLEIGGPIIPFITSNGCWWGEKVMCTFCGLNSSTINYIHMSPQKALEQFEAVLKYADRSALLFCVDNILPTVYLKEVLPHIHPPETTKIFYEIKASVTREEMKVLSDARVKVLQPGIEALSTPLLKIMKKGTTAFGNINFLKYCLEYDIHPVWNFLVGFPGEDEAIYKKYLEDLPSFRHLPPPMNAFPIRYDRFSHYFNFPEKYDLDLVPHGYYKYVYPFSETSIRNIAYFFKDNNTEAPYMKTMSRWIEPLQAAVRAWMMQWFADPAAPKPRLFMQTARRVYDSRSGEVVYHELDELGAEVLSQLEKPVSAKRLASLMEKKDEAVAAHLEDLHRKGLVFKEGDRYMSLVLEVEPPPFSGLPN